MKKIFKILFTVFLIYCGISLLIFNEETTAIITESVNRCVYKVFPSLFGFMIVTAFLLESGICSYILKPIDKFINAFFKMDLPSFSAFIFSLFGGYPTGANLVRRLYENESITKKQAKLYSACFYCGGPAFIFGLYGSRLGKYIYLSILISNIITTIILNRFMLKNSNENNKEKTVKINTETLINSVNTSFITMCKVCAMIVAFAFMSAPILHFYRNNSLYPFLEISGITNVYINPILSTVMFSFGGLCVILQVKAILKEIFDIKLFIIVRVVNMVLSGIIMAIFSAFLPNFSVETMLVLTKTESYQYGVLPIFICFFMAVMLLFETEKRTKMK